MGCFYGVVSVFFNYVFCYDVYECVRAVVLVPVVEFMGDGELNLVSIYPIL